MPAIQAREIWEEINGKPLRNPWSAHQNAK